jgi:ketosteroid isomerase-like protein
MKSLPLIFLLVLTSIIVSCGNSQKDEVREVLDKREQALETKNVDLYMSLVSPDYKQKKDDKTVGYDEVKKTFLDTTGIFDSIDISEQETNIHVKANTADVIRVSLVRASIEDSKSKFRVIDKIQLEMIDGKWMIVKESDADLFSGFAFGGTI